MVFEPKISIVIPVYNGANYLREAVDSALSQTYENVEVIVVNDGSNDADETGRIAKSYGDRIRYFYKENGGVASALNRGIEKMNGDYLSWLSHDDVYYPVKIEHQMAFLDKSKDNNVVLYSDFEVIDEKSKSIGTYRVPSILSANPFLSILSTSIHGCSTLIPRRILEDVGPFNENLRTTQDNDMWLKIYRAGFDFRHLREILIKSRAHRNQGQKLLSAINKVETTQFYRRIFYETYDLIVSNVDGVLNILSEKCINLPLSLMRNSRTAGDSIPLTKLLKYKYRILLRICINKLKALKPS